MEAMSSWDRLAESLGYTSEKEMLKLMYANHGLLELARKLAVSHYTLRKRLVLNGITIRQRGGPHATKLPEFTEELLERMKNEPIAKLADELGVTKFTLFNRRKKYLESLEPTAGPDAPSSSDSHPDALESPLPSDTGDVDPSTMFPEPDDPPFD
jgi:hypothetical protein